MIRLPVLVSFVAAGAVYPLLDGRAVSTRGLLGPSGTRTTGRGVCVARLAGCVACHTDAKGGGAVLAGGVVIETPFGTFGRLRRLHDPG